MTDETIHHELEILIVEDESESLDEMLKSLQAKGFVCHPAPNANIALQIASKNKNIGVVVTDIRMPGMDGLDLIEKLKEQSQPGIETEFVIVTGFGGRDELVRSIALQVFEFIEKPVDLKQLADVVWSAREAALSRRLEYGRQDKIANVASKNFDQLGSALHALQSASTTLASHDAEILAERGRFKDFLELLRWSLSERLANLTAAVTETSSDSEISALVSERIRELEALVHMIGDPLSSGQRIEDLKVKEFYIEELLSRIIPDLTGNASRRGVKINPPSLRHQFKVRGRPQLIARAIHNIVANAIDFTPRFHEVSIEVSHSPAAVTIAVDDEGVGMSEESMAAALAPLQSVVRPFGRPRKGLGLGLTTARLVVGLHGGRIDIKSRSGNGTRVEITLPIVSED